MLHYRVSCGYHQYGQRLTKNYQNFEEEFSHLILDLPNVCFQAFQNADLDKWLTLFVYEAQYSHFLRVEASNPASAFPLKIGAFLQREIRQIIKRTVTLHPQRQRFLFDGDHFTIVARHFVVCHLRSEYSRQVLAIRIFYLLLMSTFILGFVQALLNSIRPTKRQRSPISQHSQLCVALPTCFLWRTSPKPLWNVSSLEELTNYGTFMQSGLWMGGTIISSNPLEMLLLIITRYVRPIFRHCA